MKKLGQIFLGLMAFITLETASSVAFGAPAPASKTKKVGNIVYTQLRGKSLAVKKDESKWMSVCFAGAQKVPSARYDAPIIQKLLHQKDNLNKLGSVPSQFSSVIFVNENNYYFPTSENRRKRDVWCLYDGHMHFQITYHANETKPVRIYWHNLMGYSQMAIFEKPEKIPEIICVSDELTKNLSPSDKEYVDELLSVVNENMAFIGYIPFYKPDTNRHIAEFYDETAGCIIPEKYLLVGDALDQLKQEVTDPQKKFEDIDLSHFELQKRLGHPVYRVFTYEGHEILPVYTYQAMYVDAVKAQSLLRKIPLGHLQHDSGFPFTRYHNMRYVDSLIQLQPGWDVISDTDVVLQTVREVQYKRAQRSLHTIFDGLKKELVLQQDHVERKAVLNSVLNDVRTVGQKWDKMLQLAIDKKRFLFSLTNPDGSREDLGHGGFVPYRTTWGHKGQSFILGSLQQTKKKRNAKE